VAGDTHERPGYQGPGNTHGYGITVLTQEIGSRATRQCLACISHTRLVAKDWHPAVGKTRRLQPGITNLAGRPEGERTPLTTLHKRGFCGRETGFCVMYLFQCQSQSRRKTFFEGAFSLLGSVEVSRRLPERQSKVSSCWMAAVVKQSWAKPPIKTDIQTWQGNARVLSWARRVNASCGIGGIRCSVWRSS